MRNYIENPMTIDSVWAWYENHKADVIGTCEACACNITDDEDFHELEDGALYHDDSICLGGLNSEISEDWK